MNVSSTKTQDLANRLLEAAQSEEINLVGATNFDGVYGGPFLVAQALALELQAAAAALDATPTSGQKIDWNPASGARIQDASTLLKKADANSEEAVLAKLSASTGFNVELKGLFGDVCSGELLYVNSGILGVRDPSNSIGLPREWPIDSVLEYALNSGTAQKVDHNQNSEGNRYSMTGLRRDSRDIESSVNLAMSCFESSGSPHRPAAKDGRDAVLRLLEETSTSSAAVKYVLFPALTNWGTAEGRAFVRELTPLFKELDAARTSLPKHIHSEADLQSALEGERMEFLQKATEVIDKRLERIVAINTQAATPQGQAFTKALNEHMAGLGEAAVNSAREWQNEQNEQSAKKYLADNGLEARPVKEQAVQQRSGCTTDACKS